MSFLIHDYICILRGINLGGHKSIKMDALRQLLESCGFQAVRTYIQSGNILFQSEEKDLKVLEKSIGEKILSQFGFEVPVIVLTKEAIENVFLSNPFLIERQEDMSFLHVTFLATEPIKELVDKINNISFLPDEFIIKGKAVYLFCPNGYGNTKLNNNFFESKLKVQATTRNWKTVKALI